MNYKEFSQKIKAQHPDYADVDDRVLAEKMVAKYPEYAEQVQFDTLQERVRKRAGTLRGPNFADLSKSMEQRIQDAKQEGFDEESWYNKLLAGSGKPAHALTVAPFKRMMGQGEEVDETLEAYDTATEGSGLARTGEVLGDIAMFAVPGSKIAKVGKGMKGLQGMGKARTAMNIGFMEGAGSGLMHQAQNLGEGKDLSLGEFGAETIGSGVLPFGATAAGGWLKKQAPEVLRSSVKPVLNQMDSQNPPNFQEALKQGLVPRMGGLDKSQQLAKQRMSELGTMRDIDAHYASMFGPTVPFKGVKNTMGSGARIPTGYTGSKNIPTQQAGTQTGWVDLPISPQGQVPTGATGSIPITPQKPKGGSVVSSVMGKLKSEMGSPKGKLTQKSFDEAKEAVEYWEKQGLSRSTMARGKMTVEDALAFRQVIDDQVKSFSKQQKLSDGFDKVSKMMRRELNDYIREQAPRTGALTDEMAKVGPYEKALGRRILNQANNYKMGLLDIGAFGAGAGLGGFGSPMEDDGFRNRAALGLSLLGARRLTSTPGGAKMLYDMGTSFQTPSHLKKLGGQTLRSLYGTQE